MTLSISSRIRVVRRALLSLLAAGSLFGTAHANNVQVQLEGSLLKVIGDNAANDVLLSQNAAGDITIRGRNGTRVNNAASVLLRRVALNAVEINLENGNDVLAMSGLRPANDLFANLGAGNDRVVVSGAVTVGANAIFEGAAGDDTFTMTSLSVGEDLYIDGGIGILRTTLTGMDGGRGVTIVGDNANDVVTVSQSMAADYMSIETKGGNDTISLTANIVLGLFANTDMGIDRVTITDLVALEDIGLFLGTENDTVNLVNVSSGKSMTVSVDAGNDFVAGTGVSADEDMVIEGGAGTDTLQNRGILGGIKTDFKEFEVFLP